MLHLTEWTGISDSLLSCIGTEEGADGDSNGDFLAFKEFKFISLQGYIHLAYTF